MGKRKLWQRSRSVARLLAAGYLFQQLGCLPEQAFQQVFAENVVLSFGLIVQNITAIVFNTFFSFFPVI